jgi:hypothetical protein
MKFPMGGTEGHGFNRAVTAHTPHFDLSPLPRGDGMGVGGVGLAAWLKPCPFSDIFVLRRVAKQDEGLP